MHNRAVAETFFSDIKRYVGFTDADAEALNAFRPSVAKHFVPVTDHFYELLVNHEGARRVLGSPEVVARLKQTLLAWQEKLFTGPYNEEYHALRSRIGRRHVAIGLPQQYMLTAMDAIRIDYVRIAHEEIEEPKRLFPTLFAIHKILDLELAIMLQSYKEDSDARLRASEQARADDRIRAIEMLVAGLAHEVRNPLNAASLQLTLLKRRAERMAGAEPILQPAEVAQKELMRLESLVRSLIEFSRPSLGVRVACDVGSVVRAAGAALMGLAEERKSRLRVEADPGLVPVSGDPERLKQVFDNLIRNALEAVGPGGEVRALASRDGDGVVVVIADDGAGMTPDVLQRVFDPFFTTKAGGTGLGLAVSQAIVREHGGALRVDSQPGRGTTVEVRLPAGEPRR
jgi:signal transduction histidine kinase